MFKFSTITLICIMLFVCVSLGNSKQRKAELTNICNQIRSKHLLPHEISIEFDNYLMNIARQNQQSQTEIAIVGSIIGLFFAPIIAPLFAAPGLFGAAAMSSGLATLGGGAIAAGGFGMLGGQVVLGLSSTILTSVAVSYSGHEASFDDFMKARRNSYEDFIVIGGYQITGMFTYIDGINSLNGLAKITKDGVLVFTGSILCENTCSLIGKF